MSNNNRTDQKKSDVVANVGAGSEMSNFSLLAPLAFVSFVDAISYMIIAPSIVFYVEEMGGSKEAYGIILSVYSFSSFCFKPILGYWSDATGNRSRSPYLFSLVGAMLGGLAYFFASAFSSGSDGSGDDDGICSNRAVLMIFVGRFLAGMGAANATLGFSYIAAVIKPDQLTKATTLLTMVRIIGMATGPAFNLILKNMNFTIHFMDDVKFDVTTYNSVGLFLFACNLVAFSIIYLMLKEPEDVIAAANSGEETEISNGQNDAGNASSIDDEMAKENNYNDAQHGGGAGGWREMLQAMLQTEILLPLLVIFTMNANFQLMETGLAPAANNLLNWGPVAISSIFSFNAVTVFAAIVLSFQLSASGVSDEILLAVGQTLSIVGYGLLYFNWYLGVTNVKFMVPIVIATLAFPFNGSPSRSLFTRAVAAQPALRHHQGTLQALMSMFASIAGFLAPGIIAKYILRSDEEVANSDDLRQMTRYALFAPVFSSVCLLGTCHVLFMRQQRGRDTTADDRTEGNNSRLDDDNVDGEDELSPDEATSLMRTSTKFLQHQQRWSATEIEYNPIHHRHSCTLMGIPQPQVTYHTEEKAAENIGDEEQQGERQPKRRPLRQSAMF